MMKYKKTLIFLGVLVMLAGLWINYVGFHTGKYTSQETPFNVPGRIVQNMIEGSAIEKNRTALEANEKLLVIGAKAPVFSLPGLEDNQSISLTDFKGKIVLLEFWASWCGSCRRSHGYLWDLYEKNRENNFEIISISMDRNLKTWKKAIQQDNLIWPQACDGKGVDSQVMTDYGIYRLPRKLLLDEQGSIVGVDMSIKEIQNWLTENR